MFVQQRGQQVGKLGMVFMGQHDQPGQDGFGDDKTLLNIPPEITRVS